MWGYFCSKKAFHPTKQTRRNSNVTHWSKKKEKEYFSCSCNPHKCWNEILEQKTNTVFVPMTSEQAIVVVPCRRKERQYQNQKNFVFLFLSHSFFFLMFCVFFGWFFDGWRIFLCQNQKKTFCLTQLQHKKNNSSLWRCPSFFLFHELRENFCSHSFSCNKTKPKKLKKHSGIKEKRKRVYFSCILFGQNNICFLLTQNFVSIEWKRWNFSSSFFFLLSSVDVLSKVKYDFNKYVGFFFCCWETNSAQEKIKKEQNTWRRTAFKMVDFGTEKTIVMNAFASVFPHEIVSHYMTAFFPPHQQAVRFLFWSCHSVWWLQNVEQVEQSFFSLFISKVFPSFERFGKWSNNNDFVINNSHNNHHNHNNHNNNHNQHSQQKTHSSCELSRLCEATSRQLELQIEQDKKLFQSCSQSSPTASQGQQVLPSHTDHRKVMNTKILSEKAQGSVPSQKQQTQNSRRFHVVGLSSSHFARDTFPAFSVSVIGSVPTNLQIQLSVHNKLADVTKEIWSEQTQLLRFAEQPTVINDMVFDEVSVKHGDHFWIRLDAVLLEGGQIVDRNVIEPFVSNPIVIKSVKTHCNLKRKMRVTNELQKDSPQLKVKKLSKTKAVINLVLYFVLSFPIFQHESVVREYKKNIMQKKSAPLLLVGKRLSCNRTTVLSFCVRTASNGNEKRGFFSWLIFVLLRIFSFLWAITFHTAWFRCWDFLWSVSWALLFAHCPSSRCLSQKVQR